MYDQGFNCQSVDRKDHIEDTFVVYLENWEYLSWDYRVAKFSILWYYSLNLIHVKFNLSDDWFLERTKRVNKYALKNMDFLVSFLSEWNVRPLDFYAELQVLKEEESEVNFKYQIMKSKEFNLAKELIGAIDKGFIIIKTLQKENIFDMEDSSTAVKTAKEMKKGVKNHLKKYTSELKEILSCNQTNENK